MAYQRNYAAEIRFSLESSYLLGIPTIGMGESKHNNFIAETSDLVSCLCTVPFGPVQMYSFQFP